MGGITKRLAQYVSERNFESLTLEEKRVASQCLLDYLGVTIAGSNESLVQILRMQLLEEGGQPQASLVAHGKKATLQQAAMINGAAAHAHDFDDVHMSMSGHPTVPMAPALLALAEKERKGGADLIRAFVAGMDAQCVIGRYLGPSHYARGFHATATIGSLGAAAACANLLGLDSDTCRHAFGIAATQAAGLKSMFGTMCKPFHAGRAAANGLLAAQLAAKGFSSQTDVLEVQQGFGDTHSDSLSAEKFEKAVLEGNHVPKTLFKYHAACYLTHSAMEGLRNLVLEKNLKPEDVETVSLAVDPGHFSVCNIEKPVSGLEAKFSLRFTAAMILHRLDTARIGDFNDDIVTDRNLVISRDKVQVVSHNQEQLGSGDTFITVKMKAGQVYEIRWNVAVPEQNLDLQQKKLTEKFRLLTVPVLGEKTSEYVVELLNGLDSLDSLETLWTAVRGRETW